MGAIPQGTPSGAPKTRDLQLASATILRTTGWTPNAVGLLLPGDYIQLGVRLHKSVVTVSADALGNADIEIWPSLREAVAPNVPIITDHCVGLFRLAENKRTWSVSETKTYGISFKATEAR
jgi:hypothetical protein